MEYGNEGQTETTMPQGGDSGEKSRRWVACLVQFPYYHRFPGARDHRRRVVWNGTSAGRPRWRGRTGWLWRIRRRQRP